MKDADNADVDVVAGIHDNVRKAWYDKLARAADLAHSPRLRKGLQPIYGAEYTAHDRSRGLGIVFADEVSDFSGGR